jgi:hypothetical protein
MKPQLCRGIVPRRGTPGGKSEEPAQAGNGHQARAFAAAMILETAAT